MANLYDNFDGCWMKWEISRASGKQFAGVYHLYCQIVGGIIRSQFEYGIDVAARSMPTAQVNEFDTPALVPRCWRRPGWFICRVSTDKFVMESSKRNYALRQSETATACLCAWFPVRKELRYSKSQADGDSALAAIIRTLYWHHDIALRQGLCLLALRRNKLHCLVTSQILKVLAQFHYRARKFVPFNNGISRVPCLIVARLRMR